MTLIETDAYRAAFGQYLRKGTPIRLPLKQGRVTGAYVWRTRRDERVRTTHSRNGGRLFRWSAPPDTGHPGEDYNCRCEAVPYVPGQTEFAWLELPADLDQASARWSDLDFVWHYYTGGGQGVTLAGIGHLREMAEHYAWGEKGEGVFRRLASQIATAARVGDIPYTFSGSYEFRPVQYSHGGGSVNEVFDGRVARIGDMLHIDGIAHFEFTDIFTDPLRGREAIAWLRRHRQALRARLGIDEPPTASPQQVDRGDISNLLWLLTEAGGTAYAVTGSWQAEFRAGVFADPAQSLYPQP